jgi:transcriptional regulator with XRE-family HTH domain
MIKKEYQKGPPVTMDAKQFRAALEWLGLDAQTAHALGLSRSQTYRLLSGEARVLATLAKLIRLAIKLDMTGEELGRI